MTFRPLTLVLNSKDVDPPFRPAAVLRNEDNGLLVMVAVVLLAPPTTPPPLDARWSGTG